MPSTISDRLTGVNTSVAIKAPVKAATTENITLTGEQTLDTVALVVDDRALVKDQTDPIENGLYVVKENAWERAKDFAGSFDVVQGTMVLVNSGGSTAAFAYKVTTADDIVVGTDGIAFEAVAMSALGDLDLILTSLTDGDLLKYDSGAGAWVNVAAGNSYTIDTGTSGTKIPLLDGANTHSGINTFTELVKLSKGEDVVSANALTLGTDGNFFDITGTTSITSIATLGVGTEVTLQFDDILTLTHHVTDLILPSGENITTAAGDVAKFYEYAAGDWRLSSYTVASQSVASSALVLLETQTASADTSIAFDSGNIDGVYERYIVEYSAITVSGDSESIRMRSSSDTGVSFDDGASDYGYNILRNGSGSLTPAGSGSPATTLIVVTASAIGNAAGENGSGSVEIYNPSNATTVTHFGLRSVNSNTVTDEIFQSHGSGVRLDAAVVDALQFYVFSGTMTGTFKLYGVL